MSARTSERPVRYTIGDGGALVEGLALPPGMYSGIEKRIGIWDAQRRLRWSEPAYYIELDSKVCRQFAGYERTSGLTLLATPEVRRGAVALANS